MREIDAGAKLIAPFMRAAHEVRSTMDGVVTTKEPRLSRQINKA